MSGLPAVVSILQLGTGTLSSTAVVPASMTVAGVATTRGVTVSQIVTTIFGGLPVAGATGQILNKTSGTNFDTQWSSITQFVTASTGITVAGSTTVALSLSTTTGLSALGVAGTATAAPAAIVGTAGQVLRINDAGTALAFGAVNLASSAAVTGVLPGANVTAINLAASGAGGVQGVLPVPNGGTNTSTLTALGVLFGNGTSTVGITAAGATGAPLLSNGTAPLFTTTPTWAGQHNFNVTTSTTAIAVAGATITTVNTPNIKVTRTDNLQSTTGLVSGLFGTLDGKLGPGILSDLTASTTSLVQSNAIVGRTIANNGQDTVAVYGIAYQQSTTANTAFGGFFAGFANSTTSGAIGIQVESINVSGADRTYNSTSPLTFPVSYGLDCVYISENASGTATANTGGVGLLVRSSGGKWDVGVAFAKQDCVRTADIQTDTNATNILYAPSGAHTNGINLAAGATFSSTVISWPNGFITGTGLVNIGNTATPDCNLVVNRNLASSSVAAVAGTVLHGLGATNEIGQVLLDSYGNLSAFTGRRADGTQASKTAVQTNEQISSMGAQGYDGTTYANAGSVQIVAGEVWNATSHGSYVTFRTIPNASTTVAEAFRVDGSGALLQSAVAIPAGGLAGNGYRLFSTTNFGVFAGTGVPTLAAGTGSIYLRSDGATATSRMYVNTNGSTTWVAFNTVS